jgi:hypothetical protein
MIAQLRHFSNALEQHFSGLTLHTPAYKPRSTGGKGSKKFSLKNGLGGLFLWLSL